MKNLLLASILVCTTVALSARDAARDLRRMVGYTIVKADYISEVVDGRSGKILKLSDGSIWLVSDPLLLTPLSMTDVIIFAKKVPGLPEGKDLILKILIDNEAYDLTLIKN
jgi:hypothetical protein